MKTKFIPAIVMLTAGLIYGIISMSLNVEMFLFTKELLLVLIIFYVIGTIIRGVLDAGLKTKDDFIDIILGQSVDSVIAIDPKGDYVFLYTESEGSRISTHFTKDGYMIMIHYDDSLLVEKIDCELI